MSSPADELKTQLLGPPRRTLAVAESMTGGRVQALITAVSGASQYFLAGVTAYTLEQKVQLLGVDRDHAATVDCVSERVAGEMAAGACRRFGADWAVATTGYAEPMPARGVLVPFAWIAVAGITAGVPRVGLSRRIECAGATRIEAQALVAEAAVRALLEALGSAATRA